MKDWSVLKEKNVFSAKPWIQIFRQKIKLPNNKIINNFHKIKLSDFSIVYALTKSGKVVVEKQYKHGLGKVVLNLPQGKIEKKETPLKCAKRELLEETGYRAKKWKFLGKYVMSGNYGCGTAHLFIAKGAYISSDVFSNDLEETKIYLYNPKRLLKTILRIKKTSKQLSTVLSVVLATLEIFNNDFFRKKT